MTTLKICFKLRSNQEPILFSEEHQRKLLVAFQRENISIVDEDDANVLIVFERMEIDFPRTWILVRLFNSERHKPTDYAMFSAGTSSAQILECLQKMITLIAARDSI
jgi:hypothetical protein